MAERGKVPKRQGQRKLIFTVSRRFGYHAGMDEATLAIRFSKSISRLTRAVLILSACIALPLLYAGAQSFVFWIKQVSAQVHAVATIRANGGTVKYDHEVDTDGWSAADPVPQDRKLLRHLLGDDFFSKVVEVVFYSFSSAPDVAMEQLGHLPQLKTLHFQTASITDSDLAILSGLPELQTLGIRGDARITDAGLEHLSRLPRLEQLRLENTAITDIGLERISRLPRLKRINLSSTKISDAGLAYLKHLPTIEWLRLSNCQITDIGLAHVGDLPTLRLLVLHNTKISDQGMPFIGRIIEPPGYGNDGSGNRVISTNNAAMQCVLGKFAISRRASPLVTSFPPDQTERWDAGV